MNPQQKFSEEVNKGMSELTFPADKLFPRLQVNIRRALEFESAISLQCTIETLYNLYTKKPEEMNMNELCISFNMLLKRTPIELGLPLMEYHRLMETINDLSTHWNSMVDPIKSAAQRKVETQMKLSQGVPENKKVVKLGEA